MESQSDPDSVVIERFFSAMQAGATAEARMMALFAADASYEEPFSGRVRVHQGKAAIRAALAEGWQAPLPEVRILVDEIRVRGEQLLVRWTCLSPGIPGGRGDGENVFTIRDGLIHSLVTRLL